jgi:hypothetical protein
MTDAAVAQIGDNLPPADADPLRERLQADHAPLCDRAADLLAAAERAPETVDDDNAGDVGDFIKQIAGHMKTLDVARVAEKEPYLAGGRNVDGFFKPMVDKLKQAKTMVEARLNKHLRAKAEEERRRREEEARRQAEEEARRRAEAERLEREARDAKTLEEAIAAEEAAKQAEADRLKAQKEAAAKPADMSRTRGDYGSVASLRTFWDFEVEDIHKVPLEQIRAHLPIAAVEQAIRSYVKAGGRELGGVRIFENTATVVR